MKMIHFSTVFVVIIYTSAAESIMNILSECMNKMEKKNTTLWSKQFQNLVSKISDNPPPLNKISDNPPPLNKIEIWGHALRQDKCRMLHT